MIVLFLACTSAAPADDHADRATDTREDTGADTGADTGDGGDLDLWLAYLREDRDAALLDGSIAAGWPLYTEAGWLVVCAGCDGTWRVAGAHDGWAGAPMTAEDDFSWAVLTGDALGAYKFTDGDAWVADPWSRVYGWDENGEMSWARAEGRRMERHFGVEGGGLAARTVRVLVPDAPVDRALYVHDGQNLFGPGGDFGSWKLDESAPEGVLVVGIDNDPWARMDEYTHVPDRIDGVTVGGRADDYAAVVEAARARVDAVYGEPPVVGTMGSSLGGLVSFVLMDRDPAAWDFAASLSGTMGWGSIGAQNETILDRVRGAGRRSTTLYLDSGGSGSSCADADGDGTDDDDPTARDNYCENVQLRDLLAAEGYAYEVDLWHWHEPGAAHSEAAWAARVARPMAIFAAL